MTIAGIPNRTTVSRQPRFAMSGAPSSATSDRPDVAAGDVGADREAPAVLRELLGEQPVADRVLRRSADPRRDVDDGKRRERGGSGLGREAAAEQDPAGGKELPSRDHPGQLRVAQLDRPRGNAPYGREQRDDVGGDPELRDDPDVDEWQQHRLGVVHRMGDRQQPERPVAMDVGRHRRIVRHRPWRRSAVLPDDVILQVVLEGARRETG